MINDASKTDGFKFTEKVWIRRVLSCACVSQASGARSARGKGRTARVLLPEGERDAAQVRAEAPYVPAIAV